MQTKGIFGGKIMKEYKITINTKLIIDIKSADMPSTRDLLIGFMKVLTEKGWVDERFEGDKIE